MSTLPASFTRRLLCAFFLLIAFAGGVAGAADVPPVRITYLYDNTAAIADARAEWGFAALVEAYVKRCCSTREGTPTPFATTSRR